MGVEKRSYIVRIDTDPVVRLWTGFGPLATPADDIDPSGATWNGLGIAAIPAIKTLISGVADRVDFRLTGVTSQMVALATEDADEVYHKEIRIGSVEFDSAWQLIGGIAWEWRGIADHISIESQDEEGVRKRSITQSAASADTKRANPQFAYWTDASQRKRSPDDRFCDHVALISQSVARKFGPR